ncbi:MAG: hypothetical protein ACFFD7_14685 [Candidatus Thorarchaeota archaeon]
MINVNLNYHEILEEDLIIDMEWLKEEYELLFNSKKEKFTKADKNIANDLLNYILENTDVQDSYTLLNIMEETTSDIEKTYPKLFD